MLVFLSWSGTRSKALADFLATWLGQVLQALDPWVSSEIEKGSRWALELSSKLEECRAGIILLTPENQRSPWLLFEAGAISKVKGASVCTLLLDLDPRAVDAPLNQFQSTTLTKDDLHRLLRDLNDALKTSGDRPLSENKLSDVFEVNWPRLRVRVEEIAAQRPAPSELGHTPSGTGLSLLVAAPSELGFDVTRINWDDAKCWLVGEGFEEKVKLIPSRVGPTFRVHRAAEILSGLSPGDYAALKLTDQKGNRWEVRDFYPFENVLTLSAAEPIEKLLRDYGEGNE